MTKILLVEDEESFSDALSFMLKKEGFEVVTVDDGNTALELFARENVDLILLDVMLPGRSGIEVCTEIRKTSTVPIVMVSAKDGEIDRVLGLEIGADDYVTKPFSSRELIARIRAVLRRQNGGGESDEPENLLVTGPIRMDVDRHEVTVDGETVNLPLREFELLELFMRNPGRVLTRAQLIDRIWGSDYVGDTKTLDVHVKRIRGKIEEDPAEPKYIVTLRGLGYKLDL
ncbi:MAG: response regulator transcription factor [Candidatus Nanopelagicales bacterium]